MAIENDESPKALASRVGQALLRVVAAFVMGAAHKTLEWGLEWVVPSNMKPALLFMDDASFLVFILIFVYLLWDMLIVMIPGLRKRPGSPAKKVESSEGKELT